MERDAAHGALLQPGLQKFWQAARQRLERNGRTITSSPMQFVGLTDAEISSICALTSRRRPPDNSIRITLAELETALRASSLGVGLIDALELVNGPVIDRRAARIDERDRAADLWATAHSHPAARTPDIGQWIDSIRRRGRLTRLGLVDPAAVMSAALDVLHRLSSDQHRANDAPRPLAALAADAVGDAHALDADKPLGVLVNDAIGTLTGMDDQRSAWRTFGIELDTVSTSALCFMLPGEAGSLVRAASAAAEPLRVTGRMVDRGLGLAVRPGDVVSVCENPAIVMMAADQLGAGCAPLVCLEGTPSSVTGRLLIELTRQSARLRVHTDFDFGGIAIMNHVIARHGAEPWMMSTADYIAALERRSTGLDRLIGMTAWDPDLSLEMNSHRRAVHEEAIADLLIRTLSP